MVEETYPGELKALRGLLGQVRTISGNGTIEGLRDAVREHDETERAGLDGLPWTPQVGALYLVPGLNGAPERVARVIAEGLWRKKLTTNNGETWRSYSRSSLRHEEDDTRGREVGMSRSGRLVMMTTGGQVMGHAAEIRALRTFTLPVIPKSPGAVLRTLLSVQEAGRTAGLLMDVRQANYLKEMPGESYE